MEQALSFGFILTIACCVSFYAGRECLRGAIFLICRSAARSSLHELSVRHGERLHGVGTALVLSPGLASNSLNWTPGGQNPHRLLPATVSNTCGNGCSSQPSLKPCSEP
jgi:hypothetical protein